jgi:predicted ATPase
MRFGTNVYFDHPTLDLSCTCDLIHQTSTLTFHYTLNLNAESALIIDPTIEELRVSGGQFGSNEVTLLENKAGQVRLLNETCFLQGKPVDSCYQETKVNGINTMLSQLHDWQANGSAIAFRDYLKGWRYYDLESRRLRNDRFDPQANLLNLGGDNLASVLFRLKNSDERRYRQLLELTQNVERRLDALNFTTAGERIYMELTDERDNRFGINSASNGTLRFMALAYIILNNVRQSNPPLTIIEEPENGLYVRYLKLLFELIDSTGNGGQYIFTSHSPYFIDLFEEHIENITLMEDRGTYSALVKPDPAKVRKYLEEMPLGELHFREMLV